MTESIQTRLNWGRTRFLATWRIESLASDWLQKVKAEAREENPYL